MEEYQAVLSTLALTMGVSWASGINLYAALLVLGLGGATGNIALPAELAVLQDPLVIFAAGLMYLVEFFADKIPGVDSLWDTLHTFIRIPAGAMLAASAVGDVTPALSVAAGILGGSLAATSHAAKAGTRLMINTSPEPFTNWAASISEDVLAISGLWLALNHPWMFFGLLVVFLAFVIWLLPKMVRAIVAIIRRIGGWLGWVSAAEPVADSDSQDYLDRIARLHALREQGALTHDEYEKQKALILSRSSLSMKPPSANL
jgi:hypothetical protein